MSFQSSMSRFATWMLLVTALALSGSSVAAEDCSCKNKMQVLSQCNQDVYCKSFGPDGEIQDWHKIPKHRVMDYPYPTAGNDSTVWCANAPNESAYSAFWLKLSGDEQHAVEYDFGNWGDHGFGTEPPFLNTGIDITPIDPSFPDREAFGCKSLSCGPGAMGCMTQTIRAGYQCGAGTNIRLSLCTNPAVEPSESVVTTSSAPKPTHFTA